MVGDRQTGYIIVPDSAELRTEFEVRCTLTDRVSSEWVRTFRLPEMRLATNALGSATQAAEADR